MHSGRFYHLISPLSITTFHIAHIPWLGILKHQVLSPNPHYPIPRLTHGMKILVSSPLYSRKIQKSKIIQKFKKSKIVENTEKPKNNTTYRKSLHTSISLQITIIKGYINPHHHTHPKPFPHHQVLPKLHIHFARILKVPWSRGYRVCRQSGIRRTFPVLRYLRCTHPTRLDGPHSLSFPDLINETHATYTLQTSPLMQKSSINILTIILHIAKLSFCPPFKKSSNQNPTDSRPRIYVSYNG